MYMANVDVEFDNESAADDFLAENEPDPFESSIKILTDYKAPATLRRAQNAEDATDTDQTSTFDETSTITQLGSTSSVPDETTKDQNENSTNEQNSTSTENEPEIIVGIRKKKRTTSLASIKSRFVLARLFATRGLYVGQKLSSALKAKLTLRELAIYACFLLSTSIIAFLHESSNTWLLSKMLRFTLSQTELSDKETSTLETLYSRDLFWLHLHNVFIESVYGSTDATSSGVAADGTCAKFTSNVSYVFGANAAIGRMLNVRQLRVRASDPEKVCRIDEMYKPFLPTDTPWCLPPLNDDSLDTGQTSNAAAGWPQFVGATKAGYLKLGTFVGVASSYPVGGYFYNYSVTPADNTKLCKADVVQAKKAASLQVIHELRSGGKPGWTLDTATRAIALDLTLYNPDFNVFAISTVVAEIPPTGGVIGSMDIRMMRLARYEGVTGRTVFAAEIIFFLFGLYFGLEELVELRATGAAQYFKRPVAFADILTVLGIGITLGMHIKRNLLIARGTLSGIRFDDETSSIAWPLQPEPADLIYWHRAYEYALAATLFVSWMKIFKYSGFSTSLSLMARTLGKASMDIFYFLFVFTIVLMTFAGMAFLLFRTKLQDYRTLSSSCTALLRVILTDFDYVALQRAQSIAAPVFFVCYTFTAYFTLINMFLAIISSAYGEVSEQFAKSTLPKREPLDLLLSFMWRTLKTTVRSMFWWTRRSQKYRDRVKQREIANQTVEAENISGDGQQQGGEDAEFYDDERDYDEESAQLDTVSNADTQNEPVLGNANQQETLAKTWTRSLQEAGVKEAEIKAFLASPQFLGSKRAKTNNIQRNLTDIESRIIQLSSTCEQITDVLRTLPTLLRVNKARSLSVQEPTVLHKRLRSIAESRSNAAIRSQKRESLRPTEKSDLTDEISTNDNIYDGLTDDEVNLTDEETE